MTAVRGFSRLPERGASMSVTAVLLMPCLILAGGLAVDGAQQARARRQAHTGAAPAARAGGDQSSAAQLTGRSGASGDGDGRARAAQVAAAARPEGGSVSSAVRVEDDLVTVTVTVTRATIVLSAIGLDSVRGQAVSSCRLIPR